MSLRVVTVDESSTEEFVAYALEHGREFDESWVGPEDLASFDASLEPASIARDERGRIAGVASLMLKGYADEGTARFRIFHAIDPAAYGELLYNVAARIPASVKSAYLFAPDDPTIAQILRGLGFAESRRAYILRREGPSPLVPAPPAGVRVATAGAEHDADAWARVVNLAFADFPGRYDMTPQRAGELLSSERVLPGGALMAWRHPHPLGAVLVAAEPDEDGLPLASVDTLAIVPTAQGVGLGRLLLRSALAAAGNAGYERVDLSTDALNDRALALYRSEGFEIVDVRVCWTLVVHPD